MGQLMVLRDHGSQNRSPHQIAVGSLTQTERNGITETNVAEKRNWGTLYQNS